MRDTTSEQPANLDADPNKPSERRDADVQQTTSGLTREELRALVIEMIG